MLRGHTRRAAIGGGLAAWALLSACNSGAFGDLGGTNAGDGGRTDTPAEDEPADEPGEVTGIFLCGPADDYAAAEDQAPYGCATVASGSRTKLQGAVTAPKVGLRLKDGRRLPANPVVAGEGSPWHIHFGIPRLVLTDVTGLAVTYSLGGRPVQAALDSLAGSAPVGGSGSGGGGGGSGTGSPGGGPNAAPDAPLLPEYLVLFVTSQQARPAMDFAGLSGANSFCEAAGASVPALAGLKFEALLMKSGDISRAEGWLNTAFQNMEGLPIGDAGKINGQSTVAIRTEHGDLLPATARAWTGDLPVHFGVTTGTTTNCKDWTEQTRDTVHTGAPSSPADWLVASPAVNCAGELPLQGAAPTLEFHLYCVSTTAPGLPPATP